MSLSPPLNIHHLLKKIFFSPLLLSDQRLLLSWIMQPGMSERREAWEKKEMVRKRKAETRQIEVRDRSQPGKRDKHDLSGHILQNLETLEDCRTTGSTWVCCRLCRPADQRRRGGTSGAWQLSSQDPAAVALCSLSPTHRTGLKWCVYL